MHDEEDLDLLEELRRNPNSTEEERVSTMMPGEIIYSLAFTLIFVAFFLWCCLSRHGARCRQGCRHLFCPKKRRGSDAAVIMLINPSIPGTQGSSGEARAQIQMEEVHPDTPADIPASAATVEESAGGEGGGEAGASSDKEKARLLGDDSDSKPTIRKRSPLPKRKEEETPKK